MPSEPTRKTDRHKPIRHVGYLGMLVIFACALFLVFQLRQDKDGAGEQTKFEAAHMARQIQDLEAMNGLLQDQLALQGQMAALPALGANTAPTETAVAEALTSLSKTQSALDEQLHDLRSTATATAQRTTRLSLDVSAAKMWHETGLFVQKGDRVTIQRVSGMWSPWPGGSYDGEGSGGHPLCPCNVLMFVSHASLIARIGETDGFLVGNGYSRRANKTGQLWLGINDQVVQDNAGSIQVEVRIDR